jgi:DNA end-binding protein Ku
MARRKPKKAKRNGKPRGKSSNRAIWSGSIDFGLVNIPVKLYSAQANDDKIDFDLLDKRDFNRVRYRRVNEKTGEEVKWDQIVRGYQYEKGEYVALSDHDFEQANVEASQSIDITDFVDAADISPLYYDTPYYVEPSKNGRRAYSLLRDVMKKTGKAGIAKIVLRTRQHLAALIPQGTLLVLATLRYPHELRDASNLDLPQGKPAGRAVSSQEVKMAEQLLEAMVDKWAPDKYRDDYHEDLLKLIEKKIKAGQTKVIDAPRESPRAKRRDNVVDIMSLLRQSVKKAQRGKEGTSRQRKAG